MIRGSKVENNKSIEIFGNSDLPSRSGTFVSAETFKECLKKDSPILITVDGEEVGHIVMRNATAEENEGVNNYIKSISEPLYTRDDMIKEIEEIKAEIDEFMIISFFDDDEINYIRHCFDQHISKFKKSEKGEDLC